MKLKGIVTEKYTDAQLPHLGTRVLIVGDGWKFDGTVPSKEVKGLKQGGEIILTVGE